MNRKMQFVFGLFIVSAFSATVSAQGQALQPGRAPGLTHTQQALQPGPARAVPVSYTNQVALVRQCFTECFAANADLREQVCGGTGSASRCFGSTIPACRAVAAAYTTGAAMLATAQQEGCPTVVTSPAAAARPSPEIDRAALERRRQQRERAQATCANAGAEFVSACHRCLGSDGKVWLDTPVSPAVVRMMLGRNDTGPVSVDEEARYRCQSAQVAPLATMAAALGTQVDRVNTVAMSTRHDVEQLQLSGAPADPDTQALTRRILLTVQRLLVQREIDRASSDLVTCELALQMTQRGNGIRDCTEPRRVLQAVEAQYAPVLRATQGNDVVGIEPLLRRVADVRNACTHDGPGAFQGGLCLAARQRLAQAVGVESVIPAGRTAVARRNLGTEHPGAHAPAVALPTVYDEVDPATTQP